MTTTDKPTAVPFRVTAGFHENLPQMPVSEYPGTKGYIDDVFANPDGSEMSAGYFELQRTDAPLDYYYAYDEMKVVLEGRIHPREPRHRPGRGGEGEGRDLLPQGLAHPLHHPRPRAWPSSSATALRCPDPDGGFEEVDQRPPVRDPIARPSTTSQRALSSPATYWSRTARSARRSSARCPSAWRPFPLAGDRRRRGRIAGSAGSTSCFRGAGRVAVRAWRDPSTGGAVRLG